MAASCGRVSAQKLSNRQGGQYVWRVGIVVVAVGWLSTPNTKVLQVKSRALQWCSSGLLTVLSGRHAAAAALRLHASSSVLLMPQTLVPVGAAIRFHAQEMVIDTTTGDLDALAQHRTELNKSSVEMQTWQELLAFGSTTGLAGRPPAAPALEGCRGAETCCAVSGCT